MSVLVLEPAIFTALYDKLCSYENHKVCDINYCYEATRIPDKIEFLRTLADLNEKSYLIRYRENQTGPTLAQMIKFDRTGNKTINTYQALKYLQCLEYNIEKSTIEDLAGPLSEHELTSLETLDKIIDSLKSAIIDSIEEYKKANWSNI